MKMDPLFRSLISTFLCVGGPLILWVAYQVRPDLFVGKLKQVKWVTGFFMVLMIFTLFSNFFIDQRQPPKPVRVVPPLPSAITDKINDTVVTPPQPAAQADVDRARARRFFEIEDKK